MNCLMFVLQRVGSIVISISCTIMCVYSVTGSNKDGIKSIRNMVSASWLKRICRGIGANQKW